MEEWRLRIFARIPKLSEEAQSSFLTNKYQPNYRDENILKKRQSHSESDAGISKTESYLRMPGVRELTICKAKSISEMHYALKPEIESSAGSQQAQSAREFGRHGPLWS